MTHNIFSDDISMVFGAKTAQEITDIFDTLTLPMPETKAEYMKGNEGFLLFLTPYAMTLRIEPKKPYAGEYLNHPNVLQPIVSYDTENAVLEISPSVAVDDCHENDVKYLKSKLYDDGVFFWDDEVRNIGKLPVSNLEFPDGIPVVIDRLGVERVSHTPNLLEIEYPEKFSKNPSPEYLPDMPLAEQGALFQSLKDTFQQAEKHDKSSNAYAASMHKFWNKCQELKNEGITVAQWDDKALFDDKKAHPASVRHSADAYSKTLLKSHLKK